MFITLIFLAFSCRESIGHMYKNAMHTITPLMWPQLALRGSKHWLSFIMWLSALALSTVLSALALSPWPQCWLSVWHVALSALGSEMAFSSLSQLCALSAGSQCLASLPKPATATALTDRDIQRRWQLLDTITIKSVLGGRCVAYETEMQQSNQRRG